MPSGLTADPASNTDAMAGELIPSDNPLYGIIWTNPSRVSGAPCFYKTRVPVKNLFDSLAGGESLDEFLDGFEGVSRDHAQAVLRFASDQLLRKLRPL